MEDLHIGRYSNIGEVKSRQEFQYNAASRRSKLLQKSLYLHNKNNENKNVYIGKPQKK